jgi:hypothetical protein
MANGFVPNPTGKGGFVKGVVTNPRGRPHVPEVEKLRQAIREVEVEKKISLYKYVVERALINDNVLMTILRKFIPDMTKMELGADKLTFQTLLQILRGFANPEPTEQSKQDQDPELDESSEKII